MDLYAENILDHYKHPHRRGELRDAHVTHEENNPSCGDTLTLQLKIADGRIADVSWTGGGCAISQAGMSILSEHLLGKSLENLKNLKGEDIRKMLGVEIGPRRVKCALLCLHVLHNALHALASEPLQGWPETIQK